MSEYNGWDRIHHIETIAEAEEQLDHRGRVKIGVWVHDHGGRVEHIYEADAGQPYIVQVKNVDRTFPEEGRYSSRKAGGDANKTIMQKYPP